MGHFSATCKIKLARAIIGGMPGRSLSAFHSPGGHFLMPLRTGVRLPARWRVSQCLDVVVIVLSAGVAGTQGANAGDVAVSSATSAMLVVAQAGGLPPLEAFPDGHPDACFLPPDRKREVWRNRVAVEIGAPA